MAGIVWSGFVWSVALIRGLVPSAAAEPLPNFVVILTDDQGYGDLGVQGHPTLRTPRLDRMAAEGQRWTDFYAAANVCTPSRAALLTGRWPVRTGMISDRRWVLTARAAGGLPADEITLAEQLGAAGYATGAFGKWHLGHLPQFMPRQNGFVTFSGTPYSNDEIVAEPWRKAFARRDYWNTPLFYNPRSEYWNIPWIENDLVVERPVQQEALTGRTTRAALDFIRTHRARPFFVYLAYHMPHVPLFASEAFRGSTGRGLYGDVMAEVDAGVGEVLDTLRELGLDRRTLVVFTSDNGPWTVFRDHGGSAGSLRGDKGSTWEGGNRVPALFWWPGRIPAGSVVRGIGSQLDLFATFSALADCPLPNDRPMDSLNLVPTLSGRGASPRETMLYFRGTELRAIRHLEFKAHFVTQDGFGLEKPRTEHPEPLLYHLGHDPEERYNVAADHPDVVAALSSLRETSRAGLTFGADQLVDQLPVEKE